MDLNYLISLRGNEFQAYRNTTNNKKNTDNHYLRTIKENRILYRYIIFVYHCLRTMNENVTCILLYIDIFITI